jgi:hypothetical protein
MTTCAASAVYALTPATVTSVLQHMLSLVTTACYGHTSMELNLEPGTPNLVKRME